MRILFVTADIGSGSGWNRYSSGVVSALIDAGHTVEAVVGVSAIQYVSRVPSALRLLPSPTSVRRNNILFPLQVLQALVRRYRTYRRCDVVHCAVESYAPFAWLLAMMLRKPLVITAHGSFSIKPFVLHRAERLVSHIYASAKAILCVSEFTRSRILTYAPKTHAVVVHNGVDVRTVAQSDGSHPFVLSVGALKYRKGFHLLLEAFAEIAKRVPDAECVMVGDRDEEWYVQKLEKRIAELGLGDRVHIRTGVDDVGLEELYAKARVFVLAPVSTPDEFEGFGLVYLEANMHGVPTIGMAGSGAPEAISEGVSGTVVAEGDSAALAGAMETILTDDRVWGAQSAGALRWAKEHSWAEVARQISASYR